MTDKKHIIHKPNRNNSVVIAEGISPLSTIVETIKCGSRETAWKTYRQLKKEQGEML